jgi:NAD(P)-dependent dehydrogenase (short-subunit alcohol dehydrogenase family)
MGGALTQLFPPSPEYTEKNVGSLVGKVFLVTGGNSGIGFELTSILYSKGAKVYIAGRSEKGVEAAIEEIRSAHPTSRGALESLSLDLADLTTVAPCASAFLARETRLDVLWYVTSAT